MRIRHHRSSRIYKRAATQREECAQCQGKHKKIERDRLVQSIVGEKKWGGARRASCSSTRETWSFFWFFLEGRHDIKWNGWECLRWEDELKRVREGERVEECQRSNGKQLAKRNADEMEKNPLMWRRSCIIHVVLLLETAASSGPSCSTVAMQLGLCVEGGRRKRKGAALNSA